MLNKDFLIILFLMLFISACTPFQTATPTPTLTARFVPDENSLFEIEFNIPIDWTLVQKDKDNDFERLIIDNPNCLPDDKLSCPPELRYNAGTITIRVSLESDPLGEVNRNIENIRFSSGRSRGTQFVDETLDINGFTAIHVGYQYPTKLSYQGYNVEEMIMESLLIAGKDRVYWIDYYIAERLWESDFTKGFYSLLESVEVKPR